MRFGLIYDRRRDDADRDRPTLARQPHGNVLEIGCRVAHGDAMWATRDPSAGIEGGFLAVMAADKIRSGRTLIDQSPLEDPQNRRTDLWTGVVVAALILLTVASYTILS